MHNSPDNCHNCKSKRPVPGDCHITCADPDVTLTGDQHGIDSGWFFYPFNFDPIWKTSVCKNYDPIKLDVDKL